MFRGGNGYIKKMNIESRKNLFTQMLPIRKVKNVEKKMERNCENVNIPMEKSMHMLVTYEDFLLFHQFPEVSSYYYFFKTDYVYRRVSPHD